MKANRFESAESPDSSEFVDDTATVAKKKKKKKDGATTGQTERVAPTDKTGEAPAKTELIEHSKTLWQRLVGESSDKETDRESATTESTDRAASETVADSDEAVQLEELTEAEKILAVEEYIAARQQALTEETTPEAVRPEEAETIQANQTFLQLLRTRLQRQPAETVNEATAAAYAETVETFTPDEPEAPLHTVETEDRATPFVTDRVVSIRSSADRATTPPNRSLSSRLGETLPDDRPTTGPALLVGGVIGYVIGRRRGRIKTEKQLRPVQQKLEKEVAAVQAIVTQKEAALRTLIRERTVTDTPHLKAPSEVRTAAAPTKRPEKLGLLTLQAIEKAPSVTVKKEARTPETTLRAADMTRNELLAVSGEITVGATTLRQVYETKLISERALRRLVHEHQRGGDVRRILREEMLAKELSYERDPRLRDRPLTVSSGVVASGRSQPVSPIVSAADESAATTSSQSAAVSAVPRKKSLKPTKRQPTASPALVAANVAALIILAILLIVLVVTRQTHQL